MLNKVGAFIAITIAALAFTCAAEAEAQPKPKPERWHFFLQTQYLADKNQCLGLKGKHFAMLECSESADWILFKADPLGDGYFHLSVPVYGRCMTVNPSSPEITVSRCSYQGVLKNRQSWRAEDNGNGTFLLKLKEAGDHKCLEGNRIAEGSSYGGNAFMNECSGGSGANWIIVGGKLNEHGIPWPDNPLAE